MHLSISSPTPNPKRPHTSGGDLTLTLVPTVDIEVEIFLPSFVAVAVKALGSLSLLFEVAIVQYFAKMCCQIPY